jgi:hypothetical protein
MIAMHARHFWPQSLPRNQDRSEVRIFAILTAAIYAANLMETTILATKVDSSLLHMIASLTAHADCIPVIFAICAIVMIPHFISLVFFPQWLTCAFPRRMACMGACGAALMWFYLSYLSVPLDIGPVSYLYAFRAVVHLAFAGVLAFSLNAQQIRPRFDASRKAD